MFTSIRSRLLFTYLLLIAAILFIISSALLLFLVRNPRLAREAETTLNAAASALQRQPLDGLENRDPVVLEAAAQRADELLNARVAIFDPNGQLIVDSREGSEEILPDEVARPKPLGSPPIAEYIDSAGKTWIYATRELRAHYTLVIANPRPQASFLSFFNDEFFVPLFRSGAIALLLSLVLAFFMTRWITAPLQELSGAARNLAQGKMSEVEPHGPSELQSLARTFNEMGHKVEASQESQRDFVANISHELRTPLTSIQGFAQAILDGTAKTSESLKKSAQVIFDEAGRMQRLVNDLLQLARIDAGGVRLELQELDISALLTKVAEQLTHQARSAGIEMNVGNIALPHIRADHDQLTQVFTNLVDNAIQHTPRGGHIEILGESEKGLLKINISDDGPGIPASETKRVFERFYQVDKSRRSGQGRGSGLGLSITREVIEAHGGRIELKSEAGKGATFIVWLPLESKQKKKS